MKFGLLIYNQIELVGLPCCLIYEVVLPNYMRSQITYLVDLASCAPLFTLFFFMLKTDMTIFCSALKMLELELVGMKLGL